MGLFDQFKQAMKPENIKRGFSGAGESLKDTAANPFGAVRDRDTAQAYGEELQRLQREGNRGTGVVLSVTPTGEDAVAGTDWADIEAEITLPGQEPYVAVDRQLVPRNTADMYAAGTRHTVAVDPANPQHFAFTA